MLKAGTIVVQGLPASLLANQNSRSVKSANEQQRGWRLRSCAESGQNCGAGITCFPASQSELQVSKISQ